MALVPVPEDFVRRLQRRLQDNPKRNELENGKMQLDDDDYQEVLTTALEVYNEEIWVSAYTFDTVPKKSLLLDIGVIYALEMLFIRNLANARMYSDSQATIDELRKLPMYRQTIGQYRKEVMVRLRESKSADAINAAMADADDGGIDIEMGPDYY